MGCDIHLFTEKKITVDGKKKWHCCDHFKYNEYFDNTEYEKEMSVVPIYDGRDYELFTALANVRERDGIAVISEPRGLPDDVTDVVKKESDDWGIDGHSHSWLTARELFVYQNKHPFIHYSGMLVGEELERFDKDGIPPKSWCGWTNAKNAQWREWNVPGSVVDHLVKCVKQRMSEEFYIYDFLNEKEKEARYWKYADDFRIVFWFDN